MFTSEIRVWKYDKQESIQTFMHIQDNYVSLYLSW